MSLAKYLSEAALLLLLSACTHYTDKSPIVAKVYSYELHRSDLDGLIGEGISAEDSIEITKNYIEQWIRQMVLLSKAEKNIKDDFSTQLRDYKNSLIIYSYEQQMVNQLLDTTVTASQISDYYNTHKEEFLLRHAIVKTAYVIAPANSPLIGKLTNIVSKKGFEEHDVVLLEELASKNGLSGYYDINTWIPFHTLQLAIPITTYNENLYLKKNQSIVINDDQKCYIVRILDYKVSDEASPLEMQQDNIRNIILNHRKLDILSRMQSDLLEQAEKSENVKRYI